MSDAALGFSTAREMGVQVTDATSEQGPEGPLRVSCSNLALFFLSWEYRVPDRKSSFSVGPGMSSHMDRAVAMDM